MYGLQSGCVPWSCRKPLVADYEGLDDYSKVMQCLNCQKDECDDCLSPYHKDNRAIRMKEAMELFISYYHAGLSQEEICMKMKIHRNTYTKYKKKYIMRKGA